MLTQNDYAGSAVSDLLILCPRELDHRLRSGMSDVNLSKDSVAVIGKAAHH